MTGLRDRADAAAQVFVDDLDAPSFDDADTHHLRRVLRLRDGERIVASDGLGGWRLCALAAGDRLEPVDGIVRDPEEASAITVWLPVVKGDRTEWAVAKLTELGVDRIGLLRCDRATVRLGAADADRVLAKWRRVTREAARQSRRTRLPVLSGPLDVSAATASGAARCDLDGTANTSGHHEVMVGPEGGWSDAERATSSSTVSLGDTVLRTETAAVAAGVLLVAARRAARDGAGLEAS